MIEYTRREVLENGLKIGVSLVLGGFGGLVSRLFGDEKFVLDENLRNEIKIETDKLRGLMKENYTRQPLKDSKGRVSYWVDFNGEENKGKSLVRYTEGVVEGHDGFLVIHQEESEKDQIHIVDYGLNGILPEDSGDAVEIINNGREELMIPKRLAPGRLKELNVEYLGFLREINSKIGKKDKIKLEIKKGFGE